MITQITSFKNENRFLSNFYKLVISYKGVFYPTLEHAYQTWKTLDPAEQVWIAKAEKSEEAKYRGNKVKIREDWEKVKDGIMLELLNIKFSNPELAQKLKDTRDAELIEGNFHHDNYWGDCRCPKCYNKITGLNKLGKMLMEVRKGL